MEKIELHQDFKDFLKLLNSHNVEYLLVGGYAVGYHGYPRATGDMDIWVAVSESNALKTAKVLIDFGMPKEAIALGGVDKVCSLENMPLAIMSALKKNVARANMSLAGR